MHYDLFFASHIESSGENKQIRKRRRGLLRMYYGVDDHAPQQSDNPLDLDKAGFKNDLFMEKTLKESSLNELYRMEEKMKRGIHMWFTPHRVNCVHNCVHNNVHVVLLGVLFKSIYIACRDSGA